VRRLRELARWIGAGRGLTQNGRIKLSDARALVTLLQTGDELDPKFHGHVHKTRSSDELYGLHLLVEWSKAARLVRVVKGRLPDRLRIRIRVGREGSHTTPSRLMLDRWSDHRRSGPRAQLGSA